MALVVADRVQETTDTTGTGAYALEGAVVGFQTFGAAVSDGDTVYYAATAGSDYEVGLGTYSSGTDTIARTTVLTSSNSDSAVDWDAGEKNIFLTYPADKAVYVGESNLVPIPVGVTLNTTTGTKPSYSEGTLFYDEANGALGFYNDESDIALQVGQEEYIRVYNDSGATITNGSVVYLAGSSSGQPTIELADASGTYAEAQAIGLATHDIEDSSTGYVTTRGLVSDLDTSSLTVGAQVHLGTTAGEFQEEAPTFPNFPTDIGVCVVSDASAGKIYVNPVAHSIETLRVTENSHFDANVTVSGDLTVDGTQFINNSTNFSLAAPFTYLNGGAALTVTHSGTGLDDATMGGTFEGTASTTYYVRIDGTGTPDTFEWSKDNFSTTEATDVAITGDAQELDNGIEVTFNATTGHTLNDSWSATAAPIDVDTGLFTNRNTGASGVGYTHMGLFFDASAEKWVLLNEYAPEPQGTIDLADGSVVYGTLKGLTWEGAVSGNATTATALATGRTISLTGDVTGTSAAFDGSGNVSIAATIAANSVALGTDTTGNYVSTGATSGVGLSGSVSSEGGTFTVTSNATDANTVSTLVARDASGNFSAGTITADLSGNASTATVLANARSINGVAFDGSTNITIADSTKVPTTRTVTAGGGLTGGGDLSTNRTISHDDTSTQASVDNSGATFIQDVTLDTYGHVTALGSATISPATIGAATSAQGTLADSATQPGDNVSTLTNDAGYTTNVGDITGVTAGTGLTGGGSSGAVTLNADVGTTANKIVQLDGSARLPAVDGSQLTNIPAPSGVMSATDPVVTSGTITEDVYTITGTSVALEPDNGSIQTHTLSGDTTYTDAFSAGQAITLMIDDGSSRTVSWPTMTWVNNSGVAPALAATGYTVVSVWKIGSTLYGAVVNGTTTGGDGTGVYYFDAIQEGYSALSGTTPSVDADTAGSFALTTAGNTTFTFASVTSGNSVGFTLKITAGGTHTVTWPSSVDWAGGTAPDAPASGETDVYVFYTVDGGTTWYGALAIDAAA